MGTATFTTTSGQNWKGGSKNSGSHLIGWDSGSVRSEGYRFTTGQWPVTKITFRTPTTSVYQGANIALRYGISTGEKTYVSSSGSSTGYAATKNGTTTLITNLQPNTTYYITFFPGVTRSGTWGILNISNSSFTITADVIDYTQCSPPTSLVLSRTVQTPGQSATLSWSGAEAGTNLTIGSYDVYRSTSVDGTYTLLGNTTNTSYTVEAPSAGTYYYYKVVTKPAEVQTTYDSDLSSASNGLKGNTAPGAPTVTVNRSVVPSYGGNITFTVSPGSDSDGQTLTLAYATSSSGTKTAFTSPLSANFTAGATYYFYTYDGLAYSSATTQAITVNTKPVISTATYDSVGTYNALGGAGITGSQLGYANTITPKISTNKTGCITVELEYYSSDNTTAWNAGAGAQYATMQQVNITSTSNVVLNSSNIHQYISLGATNIHWRLRFKLNDGIEDSDYNYYPSNSDATYYSIARPSSILATYNQHSNSDISGTIAGQIWRNVRLKVYNDTSVPLTSIVVAVGESTLNATVTTSTDNQYRYIDITVPDGIAGEATINITAQMKDASNSITKAVSTSVTETKVVTLGNLTHGAPTIAPFTGSGNFSISTTWPFGTYTTIDSTTLAAYNCSTTVSNVIKFIHSSSNSGNGANRVTKTLTWSKDNDNITASMNRNVAYDWNNSLGISSYTGTVTYYCRLEIVNLFGKVISTSWLARSFDFREPAQSTTISSIDWSLDGTNWTALGNSAIQEGVYLRFNCSFGLYTTDEVRVSMLLKNSSGERAIGCYEFGSPTFITPITYASTELNRATGTTAASNSKSYVYQVTTEIADTANRQWRIKIENSGGTAYSSYKTTAVTRQCAPDLTLVSCITDASYNLTYTYSMTDNGGGSLTNYLYDGTQNITAALSGATGTVAATTTGWETKTISVKTVSVVTGLYTNTKTYYSNSIIVYQISPTVAYRKNQLGINTDEPESGAILDIHQSTGRNTILIQGLDANSVPTKFEIDVRTGEIKFYSNDVLQKTINLAKGFLT